VDEALRAEVSDQLLEMLGIALGLIGPDAVQTTVDLQAGESLSVIVTGTGPGWRPAEGGTRAAWCVPVLDRPLPPADAEPVRRSLVARHSAQRTKVPRRGG
jgi:hypothetical protein